MKKLLAILAACSILAGANGCTKKEGAAAIGAQAAVKPPVAVEVATAATAEMVEGVEVTGSLEPKFWADVKTQIPGLIKQVYVSEWIRVRKGAPLARIDVAESEALVKRAEAAIESARANLAQTQVTATRAERELARSLKLKEAGLATPQSVDDARSETAAATARIEASRAQIRVAEEELRQAKARQAKGMIYAPISGVVALRDINVGDLASDAAAAKPIFKIVDNRLLNLTVNVPSAEMSKLKIGQKLLFTTDAMPGKTFQGRVMFINPEVQAADRSLKVVAEVANEPELLKGGLFAKGRIISGTRKAVLQIPRNALSVWDTATGKASVFVIEGATARLRNITTGAVSGELVEISSGMRAGETYVARGGFNLKDGDRVAVAAAAQ